MGKIMKNITTEIPTDTVMNKKNATLIMFERLKINRSMNSFESSMHKYHLIYNGQSNKNLNYVLTI